MKIEVWLKDRSEKGTLAAMARRMAASGLRYEETGKHFRALFVLEVLVRNGGNQSRTALALGISRNKINRVLRSIGVAGKDVRALARSIEEAQ